jgi:hypothetical protein
MAKGGGAGLGILVVGGLAVLLLFSGTIMGLVSGFPSLIGDLPSQFQDFINRIRSGLPGSSGGDVSGVTWIGYTVYYMDGTFEDIRQAVPAFSLVPLSISFSGKEVSSVRVDLKAQLESGSIMGFWNATVGMKTEAFKMSDSAPRTAKTSSMVNYTKSGSSWADGEVKVLASYTVAASQLENIVFTYGDGAWLLQFMAVIKIAVTVDGVLGDLPVAVAPSGGMDFNYNNNALASLSVSGGREWIG